MFMQRDSAPWCSRGVPCSNHEAMLVLPSLCLEKVSEHPSVSRSSVQSEDTDTLLLWFSMLSHDKASTHRDFAKSSQYLIRRLTVLDVA